MMRRFLNWLLGIPDPEDLDARRRLEAERDREKDRQVEEIARSATVGKGPVPPHTTGHGADW
jgi:hypothetical protein